MRSQPNQHATGKSAWAASIEPRILLMALVAALSSCASVESVRVDKSSSPDGLHYFLPLRDIMVTVTISKDGAAPTVAVQATDAYPDFQHAFVARIPRSAIGNTKASIQVNSQGLLNSESTTQFSSSLTSILQGVAGLIAFADAAKPACDPGSYTHILRFQFTGGKWQLPVPGKQVCGFTFEVAALDSDSIDSTPAPTRMESAVGTVTNGLFYRIAIPYRVTARPVAGGEGKDFIVFSPTGSNTYFLPVAKAAFASNDATLSFDNGVPTKYGQTIQSETAGLVGLPATLLQSYFKAIGDMFGARKGSLDADKSYLDALNALALEQSKRNACSAAVAANDSAKIATDCK